MTGLVTWLVYLVHSGAGLRIMGFLIVLQCYFQEMSSKTLCADSHPEMGNTVIHPVSLFRLLVLPQVPVCAAKQGMPGLGKYADLLGEM